MIIGIGGCSNSGKSSLAKAIIQHMKNLKIIHLCQDDYMRYSSYLTKIQDHTDWEIPSALKIEEYLNAVSLANNTYDIVLTEGIFAFSFEKLYSLYSGKIFLSMDKDTFYARKKNDLRWGIEPEWYIQHIWDSHIKYGKGLLKQPFLDLNVNDSKIHKTAFEFIDKLRTQRGQATIVLTGFTGFT